MNATLELVSKRKETCFGASSNGTYLFVFRTAQGKYALSISKGESENSESNDDPAVTVEAASAIDSFGSIVELDSHDDVKYVFLSLSDRKRLHVFSVPEQSCRISASQSAHPLGFDGELFALKAFQNRLTAKPADSSGIVAAVSVSGEIALLCAVDNGKQIRQRKVEVPAFERVMFATTYGDDHLVLVAMRKSQLLFCAVRIGQGDTLESLRIKTLPEVFLPHESKNSPGLGVKDGVTGFAIDKKCAVVAYSDGYIHILGSTYSLLPAVAPAADTSFETCWCSSLSGDADSPAEVTAILRHTMRLSPMFTKVTKLTSPKSRRNSVEVGSVAALGSGFFAIAYGECVSIWDGIYCTGHTYVQAPERIEFLFRDYSSGHVFATTKDAIYRLRFGDKQGSVSVTLGAAIKYKGACDPIVLDVQHKAERGPLRSQPVMVKPTQAAAESGKQTDRIFRRLMETEEEFESKQVRDLLSSDATPSPEAMVATIHTYFKHKRRVRRGDYGDESDLGLAKLPGERLAAVTVARCIFEISCGNSCFIVPFIDMIGTGVVSSEAVISVLSVSDSWDMGPRTKSLELSSMCDPLITSDAYLNGLEAILCRIADLPEQDVVKVFRFAVNLTVKNQPSLRTESLKRWRCKRLLTKCMTHPVQQDRLVQVIRKLPFSDVITCLDVLDGFLCDECEAPPKQKSEVPLQVKTGEFTNNQITREEALMYRGLGNWVDKDYKRRLECGEVDEIEACVRWISYLIDSHLAALIIDEKGQHVASKMLSLITERRKELEALKGISGLVLHLAEQDPVPSSQDPHYRVTSHDVPLSMALD